MYRPNPHTNQMDTNRQMELSSNTKRECVFCGCNQELNPSCLVVATGPTTERTNVCKTCLTSLKDQTPTEWFRWLKRNNPMQWQKVVEHNRLLDTELAKVIRRIRIE